MNDISKIQEYLMERLDKLNDDNYIKENLKEEIARSNTVTNTSLAYLKAKNLELKVNALSHNERNAIRKFNE